MLAICFVAGKKNGFCLVACLMKRAYFVRFCYIPPLRSLLHTFVRIVPENIISSESIRVDWITDYGRIANGRRSVDAFTVAEE